MALPSGWYVDQVDSTQEIYWDGMVWTNARRPMSSLGADSAQTVAADAGSDEVNRDPQPGPSQWRADEPAVAHGAYPPRPPSRARKPWVVPLGAGIAGVVVGMIVGGLGVGAIGAINESNAKIAAAEEAADERAALGTVFPEAVDNCNADPTYAVVSDGDRTLTIDHEGDEDYLGGLSSTEMWCIVEVLGAPTAVMSHMEQTTSLDGRQTESWDNIEVSWSYHPDRGMDAVFTIVG